MKTTILVVAKSRVIGELMGLLAELAGYRPVFPAADEHPLQAMHRLRPRVVLLDCEHDISCEDEAYRLAAEEGSTVILFSAQRDRFEVEEMGKRYGVSGFALPIHHSDFANHVSDLLH